MTAQSQKCLYQMSCWSGRWKLHWRYRRRVKEQQKRVGSAEFRNTHFSYCIGEDGVKTFVTTPKNTQWEYRKQLGLFGEDPMPPGQIWTMNMGGSQEETTGLYKIEINSGPGSGVKILNKLAPPSFQESVRYAEQNLYSKSQRTDRWLRSPFHEFTVQLRAFDASKSGNGMGMAVLIGLCSSILEKASKEVWWLLVNWIWVVLLILSIMLWTWQNFL